MTIRTRELLPAIHPGEILFEDFIKPLGLSINRVARDLRVPVTRIADIAHGQRGISSDTALRLARYFSTTPAFWMNLQSAYSLEIAEREVKGQIDRDVHPLNAVA
jgi:addiction module HigA family antidote